VKTEEDSSATEHSPAEPLVVFVHIRKTAGTTVRRIIQRQYKRRNTRMVRNYFSEPDRSFEMAQTFATQPPRGLRAIHGHMLFWPDLPWAPGTRFFAFIRDPVERTISHYYWLRERSPKLETPLDDALVDGLIHDNLQTRVIAGDMPFVATEETLERALANLDRLDAIGLTERFDESIVLLTRAFDWRPMVYATENVTAGRPPRQTLTPETLAVVERYNSLDLELYRQAKARFEQAVAAQSKDFSVDVAALQRAKSAISAAPDDAELDQLVPAAANADGARNADSKELLTDARAALLLRDAEIERLRAGTERAPAQPVSKPKPSPTTRAAALDAAANRAAARIEKMKRRLEELEQAGQESAEIEGLRTDISRAQQRLDGFERRRAKIPSAADD
jgi:sulfotransferase famil protein